MCGFIGTNGVVKNLGLVIGSITGGVAGGNATGVDGAAISAVTAKTQGAWTTAGFSFGSTDSSPWVWEDGKMPRLYFEAAGRDWPTHLN